MRKTLLLLAAAVVVTVGPAAANPADPGDPFPVGACVKVNIVRDKPVCVLVDPTP